MFYLPVDGQVGSKFAEVNNLVRKKDENGNNIGGYLDPEKRNIKAMKLRGEQSDGLVLPLSSLELFTDISALKIGDQITVLNGEMICQKYIPKRNGNKNRSGVAKKKKANNYPIFKEHVDTSQLAYNMSKFKPGDECVITLKMHGSSGRTGYTLEEHTNPPTFLQKLFKKQPQTIKQWKDISGSRRVVLEQFDNSGYYGDNEFRKKWHDFFSGKLYKGETVYYEIVGYVSNGKPIMASCNNGKVQDKEFRKQYGKETVFSYGCEDGECHAYVYRITLTNEDGYTIEYPDSIMRLRCEQMGADCVPLLDKFTYTTQEDLLERVNRLQDGPDPIGKTHLREGVVVRIENRLDFSVYKSKNFYFKVLEGIVKDLSDAPDIEEEQDLITQEET